MSFCIAQVQLEYNYITICNFGTFGVCFGTIFLGYIATAAQLFLYLQRLVNKFQVRPKLSGKLLKIRCSMPQK